MSDEQGGVPTHIQLTDHEAMMYSPLALAFIGDAVYEQLVRERLILKANTSANALHVMAVERVCAEYQAAAVHELIDRGLLSEQENDVYKRGRNANGINPPKHSSVAQYRSATGLEALFGFLKLTGRDERVEELFGYIWDFGEKKENKD